ncbi:HNH endonuclease [Pseudomonas sp. RTS1]|uniref:HNH endonuclease n=1 Tax=unclassified Pseudomonas TaxID=196821 RepID=UPI002B237390|nr:MULTISPECIES: HNH endonuclease [unclassified Pseudomonas]MEA9988283.1 HNH endonuclease [Pseudomonas sp. RTS1]MEB0035770.1 HNH endonuclease [Pseudomonas sp. RTS2]MEB0236511.1 HNH endonuclease [Pseudomonas sp. 5S3]MEB0252315.1 HNH endonuclease [Pseudomonas sp. 5S2]
MLMPPEGYELLLKHELDKRIMLGQRGECRYCRKKVGEVSFRKIAHSLPELIGNKFLFSNDECDECNSYFDKTLENNLANFLGIARTTTKVQGKKGVPKVKTASNERVEMYGNDMMIIEAHDSDMVRLSKDKTDLLITTTTNSYIPLQVYKCFIKMALAILPASEIKSYKQCFEWVRHNKRPTKFNVDLFKVVRTFIPGPMPYTNAWISLFKRKGSSKKDPHLSCAVGFNNFVFYFSVPFCSKDKFLDYKKMNQLSIPHAFGLARQRGRSVAEEVNLSSSIAIRVKDQSSMRTDGAWIEVKAKDLPDSLKERIKELKLILPGEDNSPSDPR